MLGVRTLAKRVYSYLGVKLAKKQHSRQVIGIKYVKSKKKASPEVASRPAKERGLWYYDFKKRDEFIMSCEATSFAHTNTIRYIARPMCLSESDS